MSGLAKYYLIEAAVLPEVFIKVAQAMHDLETGRAGSVSEATQQNGVSRSAFYKYKDSIRPFFNAAEARMVTFHLVLIDAPGVLSGILSVFADSGANILTINQSIPVNGVASVTVSASTEDMRMGMDSLIDRARGMQGVTKIEIIAGYGQST